MTALSRFHRVERIIWACFRYLPKWAGDRLSNLWQRVSRSTFIRCVQIDQGGRWYMASDTVARRRRE